MNPDIRIIVSNIRYEIDKTNIAKLGNNVKYLLDWMYSNYTIIIDKGECHDDYVKYIFRNLLSVKNKP